MKRSGVFFGLIAAALFSQVAIASPKCPRGSDQVLGCQRIDDDMETSKENVLVVCQSEEKTEFILVDGEIKVKEVVTVGLNPDNAECLNYTPVNDTGIENDIQLHSLSICNTESMKVGYLWMGGVMPLIFTCK